MKKLLCLAAALAAVPISAAAGSTPVFRIKGQMRSNIGIGLS